MDPDALKLGNPRAAKSDRNRRDVLYAHPKQDRALPREEAGCRMVKTGVRPLEGEELKRGVDRLRTLVYPEHPEAYDTEWHDSVWRWLGTHPLADEKMQRWVIATGEGEVVGHLAAVPQHYRVNGERVVAHTPADYQVLPGYGFHALSLMRRFFRYAENCVSVDQVEEAMAVEERLGARKSGRLQYAAKLLDPSQPSRLPEPLRPLMGPAKFGLRAADEALGALFARGPEVERLDGFDESFDGLFESVVTSMPCVPEKDAAFLRWRYGAESPQSPVTVLGVKEGGTLLGYAVLRVTQEGKDGYLLDLTTRPGRRDVARSLLRETARAFAKAGVYIVRYRFMESPTSPSRGDLARLGFFFREGRRHTLLTKFADGGLQKTALEPANWSYTIGDGEATFWVR
jgi:hypothetical protein